MGRQDDLWSLFYMLSEFASGQLPWRRLKDKEQVGGVKERYDHTLLLRHLPTPHFDRFLTHIQSLTYFDSPDYGYIRSLMKDCMSVYGITDADLYDWERSANVQSNSGCLPQSQPVRATADSPGHVL
jgi:tau tubulin kinase